MLDRRQLPRFVDALLDAGAEPATARSRHLAVRRFSAWLAEEGESRRGPAARVKPPKLDAKVIEPLTDDQLRATAQGVRRAGHARPPRRGDLSGSWSRPAPGPARSSACTSPTSTCAAGDRPSCAAARAARAGSIPFGPQTARAIDRYLRARTRHRLAATPALWLGDRGKPFTYDALHKTLQYRAAAGRGRRLPPAHAAAHRRAPLARRGRLRGRPDGRRRLDPAGHADAVHQGPGVRQGRRRGPRAELGGPVSVVVECPGCHRPLCELDWIEGHAHVLGGVYPDSSNAAGRISVPGGDNWRARVTITDPALPFGATYDGRGRKTLTCRRRDRDPLRADRRRDRPGDRPACPPRPAFAAGRQ